MAFEGLTEKLQNVFKNLRSKGKLTEADVKAALKEVRMALLEADVSFKVVKQFVKSIETRAVGTEVLESLTPAQQVIKIVNEELVSLMGGEATELSFESGRLNVIMLMGLQGAGKTTTAAKLAAKLKSRGMRPLLAACDVYRPAAIEQLKINAQKVDVPMFTLGDKVKPADIVKAAREHAVRENNDLLIIDTAGRLHVDDDMMDELKSIKAVIDVDYSILVVDAMTGQDAVNVASQFDEQIGIDGIILTKLDGDTRGGAALSIRSVTDKPIYYGGMGEKLSDFDVFHPDRMASRILGMGDVLSLIEKAQAEFDETKAAEMAKRMRNAEFNFNDYLDQLHQIRKMGGINGILSMLPSLGGLGLGMKGMQMPAEVDEKQFDKIEAMILSMTPAERNDPGLLNPSRKNRIARGCGLDISEVNRVVKQFDQMKKMQKQLTGMMKSKKRFGGLM